MPFYKISNRLKKNDRSVVGQSISVIREYKEPDLDRVGHMLHVKCEEKWGRKPNSFDCVRISKRSPHFLKWIDTDLVRGQLSELANVRQIKEENVLEELFRMIPQKRLLSVEEISNCALFLASEKAAGITGQSIVIDGGYTAQ